MKLTGNERQHRATELELKRLADEAAEIRDQADGDLTDEQKAEVEDRLKQIDTLQAKRDQLAAEIKVDERIRAIGREIGGDEEPGPVARAEQSQLKSLGEQFVESEGYKRLTDGGSLPGGDWSSGQIQLGGKAASVRGKATLLEGDLTTPAEGFAAIPYAVQPGIKPILFERLTVAGLLAQGTTSTNAVRYIEETVAESGAAAVAEGADKPESTLEFEEKDSPVRKVATFLPVSEEMLSDAAQISSYITARLSLFVEIETEDQLLNGTGSGVTLNGLLNQVPGANEGITSTAQAANGADHIFAALTTARESFLEPDGIVVNTDDWAELRLLKDGNDNYIGGSPFSNGMGEPAESLWNKRVVVTSAMTAGTALVGSFGMGAQMFNRGALTTEASNSHADFFKKNLVAIRAERRLALVVYRPESFATADLGGS
jgi:HK97 family phage major capsid protein